MLVKECTWMRRSFHQKSRERSSDQHPEARQYLERFAISEPECSMHK